jgi:ABC-type Zn uptake system ZnuABC Zn-binding protein ZnuA
MKNLLIFLTFVLFPFFYSCTKTSSSNTPESPKIPIVTTSDVINITHSSADAGGNITNDRGFP